jgi:5-(carboxyamino)imidazole ribonucleotide synthase
MKTILPGSTIGILGGGQLGKMLALVARRMGYRIVVLDPSPDAPCHQVADEQILAAYDDIDAVIRLAEKSDIVTYEFENIDARAVEALESRGMNVYPGSKVLRITQNRLSEKEFVRDLGIKIADFQRVDTQVDLDSAMENIGFPAILKTVLGGYDGKGQMVIKDRDSAQRAFETLQRRPLIWERKIDFVKELGIIAVRDLNGNILSYPVSENIHVDNILDTSIVPARISTEVADAAAEIAAKIAGNLNIVGLFCVEMFLLSDGAILVNEIAPRPHNSGHYTIDACITSQFEQQLRAICALPLGSNRLLLNAVMVNILGTSDASHLSGLAEALKFDNARFHLYGKKRAKAKRKMGHLTVLADDVESALKIAIEARNSLSWVQ